MTKLAIRRRRVRFVIPVLLVSSLALGCRFPLRHDAQPLPTVEEARAVIRRVLESQHAGFAPREVEITSEKLRVLRNQGGLFRSALTNTVIYFDKIGDLRFTYKRGWYTISIRAQNKMVLLHVYTADRESAERFIDAMTTMRQAAPRMISPTVD